MHDIKFAIELSPTRKISEVEETFPQSPIRLESEVDGIPSVINVSPKPEGMINFHHDNENLLRPVDIKNMTGGLRKFKTQSEQPTIPSQQQPAAEESV